MRIEDINYVVGVARAGGIGKAAPRLGISQPALSKAVSRLEAELKTRLFVRQARGVRLTPEGQLFIEHAERIALQAGDALSALREMRQGAIGVVRVGVGIGVPGSLLVGACERAAQRGAVRFMVVGGMTDSLLVELRAGELDVVISGIPQPQDDQLRWTPLWPDPMVPLVPKTHPLTRRRAPAGLRELAEQRWVLPARGTVTRGRFDSAFIAQGLRPPEATVNSRACGREIELACALGAIVLVPRSMLKEERVHKTLRLLDAPDGLTIERTVSLLSRKEGYLTPAARQFIRLLEEKLVR
ncbi:MAG: LysR family transcriptional regulator [Burkholderiales bacterium]